MSDELDDYEEGQERAQGREEELDRELVLAEAAELDDSVGEPDETRFDETRLTYSGVEEGDGDVDVQELEEAGARLDDPESGDSTDRSVATRPAQIVTTERRRAPGPRRARSLASRWRLVQAFSSL